MPRVPATILPFTLFVLIQSSGTARFSLKPSHSLPFSLNGLASILLPLSVIPLSSHHRHSNWRGDQLTSARSNGTDGSCFTYFVCAYHLNLSRPRDPMKYNDEMDARDVVARRWHDMTRRDVASTWLDSQQMFSFRSLRAKALSFSIVREEMTRLLMSLANEQDLSRPVRDYRFFLFHHERGWAKGLEVNRNGERLFGFPKFVCTKWWWSLAMASWNERQGALVHWDWGNYDEKVISIGDKPISYPIKNHDYRFNSGTRCFGPKITVYVCTYIHRNAIFSLFYKSSRLRIMSQ